MNKAQKLSNFYKISDFHMVQQYVDVAYEWQNQQAVRNTA